MKLKILVLLTIKLQVIRAALTNYANGSSAHSPSHSGNSGHAPFQANDNQHASYYESGLSNDPNDYFLLLMHQTVSVATVFIDGPEDQWIDIGIGNGFDPT